MTRNIYQVVCRLMRKIKDMLKIKNIERSFMISEKKKSLKKKCPNLTLFDIFY